MMHLYLLAIALYTAFITASPASAQSVTPVHLCSSAFGGTGSGVGFGVAVDGASNVLLSGSFFDTVDFGLINPNIDQELEFVYRMCGI